MTKRRIDQISNVQFQAEHYTCISKAINIEDMFTFYMNGAEFATGNQLFFDAMKEVLSIGLDDAFDEVYDKPNNTINNIIFSDNYSKVIVMKYLDRQYEILYQPEIRSIEHNIEEKVYICIGTTFHGRSPYFIDMNKVSSDIARLRRYLHKYPLYEIESDNNTSVEHITIITYLV